jgi:hypothetical protein
MNKSKNSRPQPRLFLQLEIPFTEAWLMQLLPESAITSIAKKKTPKKSPAKKKKVFPRLIKRTSVSRTSYKKIDESWSE